MRAILNVTPFEINDNLLTIIKELLLRNVEIIIRKEIMKLEEFDNSISLNNLIGEFSEAGYSEEFLQDLKEGFETSSVYLKK
ncbi:MAG: hypothetical protein HQK77_01825 [Desulfobacterales bacterium]|nr:hypothetical protein [Desulfobacterales bacterium]